MSPMSMAAIGLYLAVLVACLLAARAAIAGARALRDGRRGDVAHWLALAALLALLAAFRLLEGEDLIRHGARGAMVGMGNYGGRRAVQVPLAVAALLAGIGCGWLFVRRWRAARPGSRARPVLVARFAALAFAPLYGLRLVSLHQTDRLLYDGPLPLNWILEGLICVALAGAALAYVGQVRRHSQGVGRGKGPAGWRSGLWP